MLLSDKEVCIPNAELYLRVADTCLFYYALWEGQSTASMEVISTLPRTGNRRAMLAPWGSDGVSDATPMIARVHKKISLSRTKSTAGGGASVPVMISPNAHLVRAHDDSPSVSESRGPRVKRRKAPQQQDDEESEEDSGGGGDEDDDSEYGSDEYQEAMERDENDGAGKDGIDASLGC